MLATLLAAVLSAENFEVVGYLPDYRLAGWVADGGHPNRDVVTMLVAFQVTPADDGSLADSIPPEQITAYHEAAESSNASLAVCVGGWGNSDTFRAVVGDAALRKRLLDSVAALGFNTVDFDWEYPETAADWDGYVTLLREASARFNGTVSVALPPGRPTPSELFDVVDRVHLMSYDHGYPQATLAKSIADVDGMLAAGCPPEKLVLGVPFYGRREDRGAISFRDLPLVIGDIAPTGEAFNNRETLAAKVRLARMCGLAGIMIWELGQDRRDERALLATIEETIGKRTGTTK